MAFYELRVWQQAMSLALDIYRSTSHFPKHEAYGLTQQMRRAAVSIPSNIAEGKGYKSDRELSRFLCHARGSLQELHTQVILAKELQYLARTEAERLLELVAAVGRNLYALLNSIQEGVA